MHAAHWTVVLRCFTPAWLLSLRRRSAGPLFSAASRNSFLLSTSLDWGLFLLSCRCVQCGGHWGMRAVYHWWCVLGVVRSSTLVVAVFGWRAWFYFELCRGAFFIFAHIVAGAGFTGASNNDGCRGLWNAIIWCMAATQMERQGGEHRSLLKKSFVVINLLYIFIIYMYINFKCLYPFWLKAQGCVF